MPYTYDEKNPLGRGGMAVVYEARPDDGGTSVALKLPLPFEQCNERLGREIKALTATDHPHVMPVLGHGTRSDGDHWYTMPLAVGSLSSLWVGGRLGADAEAVARAVLDAVSLGLEAMHAAGYLHRDVTPANVMALADRTQPLGMRWVIADCGLARRALGETSVDLTGSASRLGTAGYMAPESFGDPHLVTESADVYSLGRILAWLLTGTRPVLTVPLLPEGEWRSVVREFTHDDPARRPQTMSEARSRAEELLAALPQSERGKFRTGARSAEGEVEPGSPLWAVVLDYIDDYDFMIDDLIESSADSAMALARARPEVAARIAERLSRHLIEGEYGGRTWNRVSIHLEWVRSVLRGLAEEQRFGLFEDVALHYCEAVSTWDRYSHNDVLLRWLERLNGEEGGAMARAIHHSGQTDYFRRMAERGRFSDPQLAGLLEGNF